ncbi:hypothetical protein EVAR_61726_1 [Eumeta japonica]|uniref:Uncharacterized protein n=1 Tax=Eumeta variegata TaxID=151549 RepID=A0A4C1ZJM1_EUMVA|nr:hypothetical protein EVAR_61726_1 [Eumeta japonica]
MTTARHVTSWLLLSWYVLWRHGHHHPFLSFLMILRYRHLSRSRYPPDQPVGSGSGCLSTGTGMPLRPARRTGLGIRLLRAGSDMSRISISEGAFRAAARRSYDGRGEPCPPSWLNLRTVCLVATTVTRFLPGTHWDAGLISEMGILRSCCECAYVAHCGSRTGAASAAAVERRLTGGGGGGPPNARRALQRSVHGDVLDSRPARARRRLATPMQRVPVRGRAPTGSAADLSRPSAGGSGDDTTHASHRSPCRITVSSTNSS